MQIFPVEQKNRRVHKSCRQAGPQKLQVLKSRYVVKNYPNAMCSMYIQIVILNNKLFV